MNVLRLLDKILRHLGKFALFFVIGIPVIYICFAIFVYAATWLWPDFYGSYSLGNNIYMLEWDGDGKNIVNGTTIKGNTCYSGEPLIPTYENQYDSTGNFAEYVVDAKSDDNWIIVKTDNKLSPRRKYNIVNKQYDTETIDAEGIIERYVTSFTDSRKFAKKCQFNRIKIKW